MELKEAKKAMKETRAKYNAAKKNYKQSVKTGSEKQQANCQTTMNAARKKSRAAYVEYHRLRQETPRFSAPVKRVLTWTGLAIAVVVTAVGAAKLMSGSDEATEDVPDVV